MRRNLRPPATFTSNCAKVSYRWFVWWLKTNWVLFADRGLDSVHYHYNAELNVIYLTSTAFVSLKAPTSNHAGTLEESSPTHELYVPFPSHRNVNFMEIERFQNILRKDNDRPIAITLAFIDSNATITYYKLTKGLLDLNSLSNKSNVLWWQFLAFPCTSDSFSSYHVEHNEQMVEPSSCISRKLSLSSTHRPHSGSICRICIAYSGRRGCHLASDAFGHRQQLKSISGFSQFG